MHDEVEPIPKDLIDRSKVMEALSFISEQNIPTSLKVGLLIGYAKALNQTFSSAQIEVALKDHTTTDVETE